MSNIYPLIRSLKGKKVLGINPPVRDFAYFDLWAKPVGLLYLLQFLRERGNRVFLVDCVSEAAEKDKSYGRKKPRRTEIEKPSPYRNIPRRYYHFGLTREEFKKRLEHIERPDLVMVTSIMTYWYPGVWWAIDTVKEVFPDVPVVLGGIYARLCSHHASGSGADYVQTEFMPVEAPYPAMDLYGSFGYGVAETSWGCPMGCEYCASKILCPTFSRRSAETIATEIGFQVNVGSIKDVAFYDDALLLNREEHFYPVCDRIMNDFEGLRFHTPNGLHVKQIDRKCADYLYNTGFRTIRLSLESVDPAVLKESSSKVSREQYQRGVENLLAAGYSHNDLETYVLVGLPGQSLQGIRETINFVKNLGARVKTAQFSPIPGTSLYYEALKSVPALKDEPLLHNNTLYSTWISGNMTPEKLQEFKDLARNK
jgi:hypothetical protein